MIEQLRQFLETSGMSQNKAADRMGVSRSALSGYLNGKYDGDIAGMDKKAALFLEQEGDRAELKKLDIPYVETGTAKKMKGWLGLAAWLGQLGIVYGGAGLGKTTVLKQYAATNPLALLIEPDTGYTAKVLLQEICHALDLSERGNIHELTERVKPTRQIGVVTEFTDERMVVDFFLDGEDGYVPKSFLDCFELLRAANPNPDTARLDWMILRDYPGDMNDEDRAFTLQTEREDIDTFIRLDAEQGAEA